MMYAGDTVEIVVLLNEAGNDGSVSMSTQPDPKDQVRWRYGGDNGVVERSR